MPGSTAKALAYGTSLCFAPPRSWLIENEVRIGQSVWVTSDETSVRYHLKKTLWSKRYVVRAQKGYPCVLTIPRSATAEIGIVRDEPLCLVVEGSGTLVATRERGIDE